MRALLLLLLASSARAAPSICSGSPSVEDFVAAFGKDWTLEGLEAQKVTNPLTSYFVCAALSAGDSSRCAGLEKVARKTSADPERRDKTLAQTCRMEFDEDRMIRAFLTGAPSAPALCEVDLKTLRGKPLFKPGRLAPVCARLAKDWLKPALACAAMRREFAVSPKDAGMEDCELEVGVASGDRAVCAKGEFPDRVRHCEDFAAYRAALAAKDAQRCGESGICRALMGQKAALACGVFAKRVKAVLCGKK